jgi:AcrR family transcriptional regulator
MTDKRSPGPSVAVARPPQQGRSRASFERMLNAAEALLIERGSDNFALSDVGQVGRVSIGSIYNRFASKDELIQAVHARLMDRMDAEQNRIVMKARSRGKTPVMLVRAIVDELGQFLASHAGIMRPMMLRAAFDTIVQDRGRRAHDVMADAIAAEILLHRSAITHPDPERAVWTTVRVAYAAFARELGFGMAEAPAPGTDWAKLKVDVGDMAANYLFCQSPK